MTSKPASRKRTDSVLHQIWFRFLAAFIVFAAINLLVAHFTSDCGLPALLGMDACNDDIVRLGWPLKFYEEGGIAFHSDFSVSILAADLAGGILGAFLVALGSLRLRKPK